MIAAIGVISAGALGATPSGAAAPAKAGNAQAVPLWAKAKNEVGAARGPVTFSLVLPWRNHADLRRFNASVSNPRSANYGSYLTPTQFRARFGPTASDVATAQDWLRSHGFGVEATSESGNLIQASGSTARTEKAFSTQLARYRYQGHALRAPANSVTIPSPLRGTVQTVIGLDQAYAKPLGTGAPPPPIFRNAKPCSSYYGQRFAYGDPKAYGQVQPFAPCGYVPDQLQGAYGVADAIDGGLDGSGQTVTVIDAFAAPTIEEDVNRYSSDHGLPPVDLEQQVFTGCQKGCGAPKQQGWYGEETLDIEAVHSMAPGATIQYVGGADAGPGLDFALQWVADNAGSIGTSIVTNSYGFAGEAIGRSRILAEEETHEQAIAEGVGLYFASGDEGDDKATRGYVTADYPASSPNVTAVGGTTLAVGPLDNYRFEVGWGTHVTGEAHDKWNPKPPGGFLYGSGGGTSRIFGEPDYQQGVVPDRLSSLWGGEGRVVPDISMDGDPTTGMLVGETQTDLDGSVVYAESRSGGTSLSSPLFAGIMALADQQAGVPHGFVNPALYGDVAATPGAVHDIVPARKPVALVRHDFVNAANADDGIRVSLRSADLDRTLRTRPGYDNVTGIGSPRGESFLDALSPLCKRAC